MGFEPTEPNRLFRFRLGCNQPSSATPPSSRGWDRTSLIILMRDDCPPWAPCQKYPALWSAHSWESNPPDTHDMARLDILSAVPLSTQTYVFSLSTPERWGAYINASNSRISPVRATRFILPRHGAEALSGPNLEETFYNFSPI